MKCEACTRTPLVCHECPEMGLAAVMPGCSGMAVGYSCICDGLTAAEQERLSELAHPAPAVGVPTNLTLIQGGVR